MSAARAATDAGAEREGGEGGERGGGGGFGDGEERRDVGEGGAEADFVEDAGAVHGDEADGVAGDEVFGTAGDLLGGGGGDGSAFEGGFVAAGGNEVSELGFVEGPDGGGGGRADACDGADAGEAADEDVGGADGEGGVAVEGGRATVGGCEASRAVAGIGPARVANIDGVVRTVADAEESPVAGAGSLGGGELEQIAAPEGALKRGGPDGDVGADDIDGGAVGEGAAAGGEGSEREARLKRVTGGA